MNKIITCIDGSALSDDVCKAGVWAATKLDKTLLLLHAIEKTHAPAVENLSGAIGLGARSSLLKEMASLDEQRSKIALTLGKAILEEAQQLATTNGCQRIETMQRHGGIVEAILDLESDARLLVVGRLGEDQAKTFKMLGSHIEQVIRQAHTPVLIVNKNFVQPKSFMLAYDGRATADKAVKKIIEGGLLQGLTCHLVTVKNKQAKLEEKFKQTEALLVEKGFEVKASFLEGNIFDSLEEYKQKEAVDLLVMGAFSHSKLATVFLGSNTLKMIENTQLPLLILH
ncbi:universal stress protein [Marinospirillum minutulum]|uniref:universal stress protein n=1 Tax=Marinospirillum minutulum TaxID=64974 RepID=UPI0003F8D0C1|nr:universal stress protein [Marinospirillum minutulum]